MDPVFHPFCMQLPTESSKQKGKRYEGFLFAPILSSSCPSLSGRAEKLLLAHVAINPGQGMLLLAKDSGFLAKYGFRRKWS